MNIRICRCQLDEIIAESELHPVTEETFRNDQAAAVGHSRTEFLHIDVVYAIRRAEAVAVGRGARR